MFDNESGVNFLRLATCLNRSGVIFLLVLRGTLICEMDSLLVEVTGVVAMDEGWMWGNPPMKRGSRVRSRRGAPGGVCGKIGGVGGVIFQSWRTGHWGSAGKFLYLSKLTVTRFVITMCVGFLRGCMLI